MKKYPIRLSNLDEVTAFVKTVTKFDCDMDLCRGSVIIDAKSYLGIMTMCTGVDYDLIIHKKDPQDVLSSLSDFLLSTQTA
jgi:phosphotransferase system HPr-like phosphotransfer protein